MGAKRLTIELDPIETLTYCVYSPGHVVSGVIVLWGSTNTNINGLYIEVEGRVKVAWNKNDSTYRAQHSYLHLKIPLFLDSSFHPVVGNGLRFPFKFALPPDIPSSYEGKSGNIRYSIKAVLKRRSLIKFNYTSQLYFTVNTMVELSQDESFLFPLRQSISKPRSGLKRIMADAWLDKTGYTPGEKIQFNATIDNYSGKSVRKTTVQLIQYTTFTDGRHKNKVKKILWQREGRQICDKEVQVWEKFPIVVPHVPASGMPFCNLIDTSYVIKLIINPGFFFGNLTIRLDIVIGNVRNIIEHNSSNATILPAISPDCTLTDSLSCGVGGLQIDSPPPTYEECERTKCTFRASFTTEIKRKSD